MGSVLSSSNSKKAKILILGLSGAGKTTVHYKLKLNEVVTPTVPTIGFSMENKECAKYESFTIWEVGGLDMSNPLLGHHLIECGGLVYVVDSADETRFSEAQDELKWIFDSDEMKGVPLVLLANKQDMPKAQSPSDVATKLGLSDVRDRKWHVQGTCAISGEGVYEAIDKLSGLVKEFQKTQR